MKSTEMIKFNPVTGDYLLVVEESWINHYSRKRVAPFYGITERKLVINITKTLPTFEEVNWEDREEFIMNYIDFFIDSALDNTYTDFVSLISQEIEIGQPKWDTKEQVMVHLEIDPTKQVDVVSPY